jgi:hypothetical protein
MTPDTAVREISRPCLVGIRIAWPDVDRQVLHSRPTFLIAARDSSTVAHPLARLSLLEVGEFTNGSELFGNITEAPQYYQVK